MGTSSVRHVLVRLVLYVQNELAVCSDALEQIELTIREHSNVHYGTPVRIYSDF